MLTYHKATIDKPAYYEDSSTGAQWRRIAGGIGWPQAGLEGVGLILAEDATDPPFYKALTSVQGHNALTLIEQCKALELEYPVKGWHCNAGDLAMMMLLHEFNKERTRGDKLIPMGAPLAGEKNNSGYYLPRVIEMGLPGKQRLSMELAPVVRQAAEGILPDVHLNRDIAEFPALAALCYPLGYMLIFKGPINSPTINADRLKRAVIGSRPL